MPVNDGVHNMRFAYTAFVLFPWRTQVSYIRLEVATRSTSTFAGRDFELTFQSHALSYDREGL
jgi:hypothetical protein